jgi:hypothetical protein
MTCMLVLLAPLLMAAEPAPKADETTTLDRKGQVKIFGGNCRVKRTRSEMLLDIDPNPPGTAGPMKARTRLILTPFTAKRLQAALQTTMQRHEAVFGAVEVPEAKQPKDEGTLDPGSAVVYANFCRVTATAEEVLLDFGLDENLFGAGPKVIAIEQKVILTHVGSKVLLAEFTKVVAGYEAEFGLIELDVRKRAKKQPEP